MYKCNTCGKYVDKLPIERQTVAFLDGEPIEEEYEYDTCSCGGWLKETAICGRCGDSEIEDDFENGLCSKCQSAIWDKLNQLLRDNFTSQEFAFIYDNLEDLEYEN